MDESTQMFLLIAVIVIIFYMYSNNKHMYGCGCQQCRRNRCGCERTSHCQCDFCLVNKQNSVAGDVKEPFAGDLENESGNNIQGMAETGDYQEATKHMALEPTVSESHARYVSDIAANTQTASKMTLRSDPNDIVPWVGLRRPNYHGGAQPMEDARTVSTDMPHQMMESRRFCI